MFSPRSVLNVYQIASVTDMNGSTGSLSLWLHFASSQLRATSDNGKIMIEDNTNSHSLNPNGLRRSKVDLGMKLVTDF